MLWTVYVIAGNLFYFLNLTVRYFNYHRSAAYWNKLYCNKSRPLVRVKNVLLLYYSLYLRLPCAAAVLPPTSRPCRRFGEHSNVEAVGFPVAPIFPIIHKKNNAGLTVYWARIIDHLSRNPSQFIWVCTIYEKYVDLIKRNSNSRINLKFCLSVWHPNHGELLDYVLWWCNSIEAF